MTNTVAAHPILTVIVLPILTFLFNNVVSVLVSNLPAPTKDSTPKYVYWFKVANTIIGNLKRAQSTSIEDSPNFEDAVQKYIAQMEASKARLKELNEHNTDNHN